MNIKINGDRMVAILIINGKPYMSDCDHQECLYNYQKDIGILNALDDDEDLDCAHELQVHQTFEMKNSHQAYGFDVFDTEDNGVILVAHDKETFDANQDFIRDYKSKNAYEIKTAYFTRSLGYDAELMENIA